jgi:oligopeptide/dipeptide ABC transporter ATP-binding protein
MGLTNAFPDLARAADQLVPIPGSPPDLREPPPGCRFAARCPFAVARCRVDDPPLVEAGGGRRVSCWRMEEAPTLRERAKDATVWAAGSTSAV